MATSSSNSVVASSNPAIQPKEEQDVSSDITAADEVKPEVTPKGDREEKPEVKPTGEVEPEKSSAALITLAMASEQPNPEKFLLPEEKYFDDEEIEKFKKYEADYSRYLMSKYFSDKNIFGGNIFDVKMTKDGETIKASRLPPYASFADPEAFMKLITVESTPEAETPTKNTSNGNQPAKKST